MKYRVEAQIFESFPAFFRAVIVAFNVNNTSTMDVKLETSFRDTITSVELDSAISEDHYRIRAWSDVYRTFPLADARRIRPSIGSLVRRIKRNEKQLPFISPLVCISNLISLRHLTPSGLIDASRVTGELVLGFAQGSESFVAIGSEEVTRPEVGEIIYFDDPSRQVFCRAWNSRGAKGGITSKLTRSAVMDIDGLLTVIDEEEIMTAAQKAASLISDHCGATTEVYFLNKRSPIIEFVL